MQLIYKSKALVADMLPASNTDIPYKEICRPHWRKEDFQIHGIPEGNRYVALLIRKR